MNRIIQSMFACLFAVCAASGALAQLGGGKGGPSESAPAVGASPSTKVACTVTGVNTSAFTFDCQGATKSWTCNVYSTTVFALGSAGATFYDLKVGTNVNVAFHKVGTLFAADNVSLQT